MIVFCHETDLGAKAFVGSFGQGFGYFLGYAAQVEIIFKAIVLEPWKWKTLRAAQDVKAAA